MHPLPGRVAAGSPRGLGSPASIKGTVMKKIWKFIRAYWYIPVFIIAVILGWVIFRKRGTPIKQTQTELEAIKAAEEAREWKARLGAEMAKKQVEAKYREEVAALNEKQAAQAKELEDDPVKLAKFLVRAARH